jgi:hypothetical protein
MEQEFSQAKKEEIMAKVALAMTLAEGTKGTPEGDNALAHALRLMNKYRIKETELDFGNNNKSDIYEDSVDGLCDRGGYRQWVVDMGSELARTFDCRMYMNTGSGTMTFMGTEKDLITVTFFFENVLNHINKGARAMWPVDRNWNKRNQFGTSAGQVIGNRLHAIRKAMDASAQKAYSGGSDLMVVKSDAVNAEYNKIKFGRPLKRKDVSYEDKKTWAAGRINGETAALNLGINE